MVEINSQELEYQTPTFRRLESKENVHDLKLKKMKIVITGAGFNTFNLGVGALTVGAIKAIIFQYPNAEIYLLDYGKESGNHYLKLNNQRFQIQLINIRFSKKFYLRNNVALLILISGLLRFVPFKKVRRKITEGNPYLKHLSDSNMVVAVSGGDSFSDIYGMERFLYVSLPQILAIFLGKVLILLPQTIGPFRLLVSRQIAKYIMNNAKLIYSRDLEGVEETKRVLKSSNSCQKVRFCHDLGFILDPELIQKGDFNKSISETRANRPLVGLNVSGLLYHGGYSGNNMFGLKINYVEFIRDLINFIIEKKNCSVVLVPHVLGNDRESDSVVCQEIYTSLQEKYHNRILIANGDYDQSEIKYVIGQCDFFIGSRMHSCIAALSQNIPTVSIAYSSKFFGVMKTIQAEQLVADPRVLGKDEILKIISDSLDNSSQIRGRLKETMPYVKDTVLKLFKEIGTFLEGN